MGYRVRSMSDKKSIAIRTRSVAIKTTKTSTTTEQRTKPSCDDHNHGWSYTMMSIWRQCACRIGRISTTTYHLLLLRRSGLIYILQQMHDNERSGSDDTVFVPQKRL